jgi:hypothetical protein
VRSDIGGERINQNIQLFFNEKGIIHETSCVGTSEQNKVAKQKINKILKLQGHYFLKITSLPYFVSTAVYLLNRIPTKPNNFESPLHNLATHVNIPSYLNLAPKVFWMCSFCTHSEKNSIKS